MPSVAVKLYSVFFKFLLKHRLQSRIQSAADEANPYGITCRPEESVAAANPAFTDGVATKDIHIDTATSLTVRIFLPDSALNPPDYGFKSQKSKIKAAPRTPNGDLASSRRSSLGPPQLGNSKEEFRRNSYGCSNDVESLKLRPDGGPYRGYLPSSANCRKLPLMLQDHYFDVVTNVVGLVAAVLGDKILWWIDPVGAIALALYTITNWSGMVLENAVTLVGQSAITNPSILFSASCPTVSHDFEYQCITYNFIVFQVWHAALLRRCFLPGSVHETV